METHRITFTFKSPVVLPDRPLHFDALVAFAAFRMAERAAVENPLESLLALPFATEGGEISAGGIWKASQIVFEKAGPMFWNHYTRRHDVNRWSADKARGRWEGNKNVIPVGSDSQKAFSLFQPVAHVRRATAWFVGDPDLIGAMLKSEVFALGRNIRAGWGRIENFVINTASIEEAECWRRRALPYNMKELKLSEHFLGTATVRPPYWDRAAWQKAWEYDASAVVPA